MPDIYAIAAIFTIVGGTLALIQLFAILSRLNRRPRLRVSVEATKENPGSGDDVVVLMLSTTNWGSVTAHSILWNYDLPTQRVLLDSESDYDEHEGITTIARSIDHLHPRVAITHQLRLAWPDAARDLSVQYRIHLEDLPPQSGELAVTRPAEDGSQTPPSVK